MRRTIGFWSGLAFVLLSAGSALADPTAADRATARSLAGEGYQALQAKDYATAIDRFSRADALVHAPTLMIDWARSLVGVGKLVEAQERYEQIIREGVDPKAPKSWQKAFNDANTELAALKPRLAWVTINVAGTNDAHVTVDGAPVPPAAIGVRRAMNPGERLVRVVAQGYLPQKKTLQLAEGSNTSADFTLQPDPDQQAQASTLLDTSAPAPSEAPPKRKPTLAYVAIGVGGAGILAGGISGILAMSKHSQLSKACPGGACPNDQSDNLDSYHTLATVSDIGFAIGIPIAATGVALLLLNRPSGEAPPPPATGFQVHPYFGGTSVGAVGSF
ncbi:MAG TPA: hypothetical protein VHV51_09805 [Polyangiaceae bacterium]|jgi:hypothetical protein|nr:hypothetical protein [Polyangiaceae bacterium]